MAERHILPTPEEVTVGAAEYITTLAEERVQTRGRFTVALSGGSTPRRLYETLASPPYVERLAWERCVLLWSDERCVPPDHRESNYRLAKETLLDRVPVLESNVHRMRGEAPPPEAAEEYQRLLRQVFDEPAPSIDLVLLGLGSDGHTASLFPGTNALQEERRLVVANWIPQLDAHRLTFTLPLLNAAAEVAFLVTDEAKAEVVRQVLQPTEGESAPPAALVQPAGKLHWFLSKAVASRLSYQGYC